MGLLLITPRTKENPYDLLFSLDYLEGYKSSNGNLLYQGLVMNVKAYYRRAVFLYIRETPNMIETIELNKSVKGCDMIIGDLNLIPKIPEQDKKISALCGRTKCMALRENTTVNDSQLEHIIIEKELEKRSFCTSYFNLASDHRSITFRISSPANSFTDTFKQKINFDSDFHMKKVPKKIRIKAAVNKEYEEEIINLVDQEKFGENALNHSFKLLRFINPEYQNLCFSNSVVSALLNLSTFGKLFSNETKEMKLYAKKNKLLAELVLLKNVSNLSKASTKELRSIVSSACGDGRNFDDNFQHDAGEFLVSMFDNLFRYSSESNDIDEQLEVFFKKK